MSSLSSWFSISATPINVDDAWKGLERYGKSIDSATPRRLGTGLLVVSKPEANDEARGLELEGAWMGQNGAEWTKS